MAGEERPLLQIETEKQPGKTIVHCAGKVVIESAAPFLHAVRALIAEGKPIFIDLANVTQVDSVGIGNFVSAWASARKNGVELKFINLNEGINDLFEITRLKDMFGTDTARA